MYLSVSHSDVFGYTLKIPIYIYIIIIHILNFVHVISVNVRAQKLAASVS